MATIEHTGTRARFTLSAQTLIGRSSNCDLQLTRRDVSGQHALIRWTNQRWELRDLGSRNGTFFNNRRLEAGERVTLGADARMSFGGAAGGWMVLDVAPPVARAIPEEGAPVNAEGGMLALPPGIEPPEVVLYLGADSRWVEERAGTIATAEDVVEAGGRRWKLQLPQRLEETWDVSTPTVQTIRLRFEVSRDEEFTRMTAIHGGRGISLTPRAHHYLLLTLARERLEDIARAPGAEDSHGWIEHETLARLLRIERAQVNLQVYRARRQLAAAGIANAARLIERRTSARQLRIGVSDIEIVVL